MYRTIGFEIETRFERDDIYDLIEEVIQNNPRSICLSDEETNDHWTLKYEHCGSELTSPVLLSSKEDFNYIKDIISGIRKKLLENGFKKAIDRNCGLHVHVGLDDFKLENVQNLLISTIHFEEVLLSLQPDSRSNNSYVHLLNNIIEKDCRFNSIDDIENSELGQHYSVLNFEGFNSRRACEFRHSASTIRHQKLLGWIKILLSLVECAKSVDSIYDCLYLERYYSQDIEGLSKFFKDHKFISSIWLNEEKQKIEEWMIFRNQQLIENEVEN